jgi:hypothetical protein
MKTEFLSQYGHTWRVFARLVADFEPDAWLHTGRGAMTPARLALHILKSARYYMEDPVPMVFPSGRPFDCDWVSAPEEDLPSQADLLACIADLQARTQKWLAEMDFTGENTPFPWAGATRMGVALFSLRHSLYHLGELSSLLNESKHGVVEDNYVKAI